MKDIFLLILGAMAGLAVHHAYEFVRASRRGSDLFSSIAKDTVDFEKSGSGNEYRRRTANLLTLIDEIFIYRSDADHRVRTFSIQSFLIFFSLALVYPVFSLAFSWVSSNYSSFGDGQQSVFRGEPDWGLRLIAVLGLFISIACWWSLIWRDRIGKNDIPIPAPVLLGLFFGAFCGYFAEIGAMAAIVSAAFAPLVYYQARVWRVHSLFYILAFAFAISVSVSSSIGTISFNIFFLVFLPLVNALLDWLSFGLTRKVLAISQSSNRVSTILMITATEYILSFLSVMAVIAALIAVFSILNSLPTDLSFEWLPFVQNNPVAIILMLSTSFVPTYLHLFIIAISSARKMNSMVGDFFHGEGKTRLHREHPLAIISFYLFFLAPLFYLIFLFAVKNYKLITSAFATDLILDYAIFLDRFFSNL